MKFAGSRTSSFLWFVFIMIFLLSSEKFSATGKPFSSLHAARALYSVSTNSKMYTFLSTLPAAMILAFFENAIVIMAYVPH